MKKVLLPLLLLAVYCVPLHAQVSINTDGTTPDASAMLDIKSTKYGALMPRMTTVQRTAIVGPADGLWVYDTDTKTFWFYKGGTGWTELTTGGGGGGLSLPYAATVTSAATLFSITNSGSGAAAHFEASAATNTSNILSATGYGAGLVGDHTQGNVASFFVNNINGVGAGVRGETNSQYGNNGTAGVYGTASGTGGYGGYFEHSNATGFGNALYATNAGIGVNTDIENTNATNAEEALRVNTNGTGPGVTVSNTNANSTANTIYATSTGPGVIADHTQGNVASFFANNTNGVGAGVRGETNSMFGNAGAAGVYGISSGAGGFGGYFDHTSTTGFGYALYAGTLGMGSGAVFETNNASNAQPTISVTTNGTGSAASLSSGNSATTANVLTVTSFAPGVVADHSQGNAGNFFVNNTNGVGAGVRGETNSQYGNNGTAGVYGTASGTGGYGGYFEHSNATGFGNALYATNAGIGVNTDIENTNATNAEEALRVNTNGTGPGVTVSNTNANSTANTIYAISTGPGVIADHTQGNVASFFANNTNGVGAGVRGETNSEFGNYGTAGVYGSASGTGGYGGYFDHTNATGFGNALFASNAGLGVNTSIQNTNATNAQSALQVLANGVGSGATISNTNANNTSNTLYVTGYGPGVIGDHSQGNAASFFINNTNGVGAGVRGETNSVYGNNGAAGVYGVASGTGGYGGYFEHTETTGYGITLQVVSNDIGSAMVVDKEGSSGDLALFQKSSANMARIDINGKGYFNGGTQNSGADLAEAFDVEGTATAYEPGDVLLISTTADRTVIRSYEAYSNLVAGVYATKPGVLLTEDSLGSSLGGKVPMGVVGVIPTKVCNENGAIHRGDILVTSSRTGYAMKADLNKLKAGQAIGKALEEFSGEIGKIKVLVNVK